MTHEYNRFDGESANGSNFMMGLLAGTVLGAGLAMLFAPKPGSELRSQLPIRRTALRAPRPKHTDARPKSRVNGPIAAVKQDRKRTTRPAMPYRAARKRLGKSTCGKRQTKSTTSAPTAALANRRAAGRRSIRVAGSSAVAGGELRCRYSNATARVTVLAWRFC